MNRFAPLQAVKSRPVLGVIIAILVPLLTAGILMGVLHKPQENLDEVTAAIVNNDEPVELDGQLVPLGRQLAGGLVASGEKNGDELAGYQWEITDASRAAAGLDDGTYGAIITIPPNFSAAATSTAGDVADAEQATIAVTTSPHARLMDDVITRALAIAATDMLGTELTQSYLDNIFIGFNTLHSELGSAAAGAQELAEGSGELAGGLDDLGAGVTELGGGANELSAGAQDLAGGLGEFNGGILKLKTGGEALAQGASDLAGGAGDLADGVAGLEGGLEDLAGGGADLAAGLSELASGTSELPAQLAPLQEGLTGLSGGASDLKSGLEQQREGLEGLRDLACSPLVQDPTGELCAGLQLLVDSAPELIGGADGLAQGAGDISEGVSEMTGETGPLAELAGGIQALADGSNDLASGLDAAHDGAADAARGARDLAGGAGELAQGADELSGGIAALEDGSSDIGLGAAALSSGTQDLASAIEELEGGVDELAAGGSALHEGAEELADGLGEAVEEIPTYPDEHRESAAAVIADPVGVSGDKAAAFDFDLTRNWIGFFAVIALWISALWIYTAVPTTISNVGATTRSSARISLRSLALPTLVAAGQGLTVTALVGIFGDISGLRLLGFAVVATLIAVAFLFVQRALLAVAGRIGLVVSLAVAILAIGTALTSAQPGIARAVVGWLPIGPATEALNGIENGFGIAGAIVALIAWAVAGWVVIALNIRRRRVALPAAT